MRGLNVSTVRKKKQSPGSYNAGAVKVKEVPMRSIRVAGLVLGCLLLAVVPVAAQGHWRGHVAVVPMVRPWGWYGFGYGFYEPYGYYYPFATYRENSGEVKLDTNVKNADVYINGALAGTAGKLKSIWLRADAYNLEIRAQGYTPFEQKVFVIAGKTIRVHADLIPGNRP